MEDYSAYVYSRNAIEFVAVANEYCQLVENNQQYPVGQLLEITRKLLPLLYYKASLIPEAERIQDDELDAFVSELDYNILQQRWLNRLGDYDLFRELPDPELQFGNENATASISEHLLDIYQDVKDFVSLYSIGNEDIMHDALVECQSRFAEGWGLRLVNVLRPIHLLSNAGIDWSGPSLSNYRPPSEGDPASKWVDRFFDQDSE